MTAEEIREHARASYDRVHEAWVGQPNDALDFQNCLVSIQMKQMSALFEIAAQLAEFNEGLRSGSFVVFSSRDGRRDG
jgi:hypothetical protein